MNGSRLQQLRPVAGTDIFASSGCFTLVNMKVNRRSLERRDTSITRSTCLA